MNLKAHMINTDSFLQQRQDVLEAWPTGQGLQLEDGFQRHGDLPEHKVFDAVLQQADREGGTLLQPRAGVALVGEHVKLLRYLAQEADLLPTTIDAYTRLNHYQEADEGIRKSQETGQSLLNGFPAVNHGVVACQRVIDSLDKPVEVRHGTPDARLLAEITLRAGFTSFEGGGISYNLPYAKRVPLEKSLRDWQYVDRLTGLYQEQGLPVNREPFGPLSGTLIPPFIGHVVAILEGLLALEQGVKSITLAYGQAGNVIQDVAAIFSLRELAHSFFQRMGYSDYCLTTAFHQWMGGFPADPSKAYSVIAMGSTVAALAGVTKVIVKTPHEAVGIPTRKANLEGLKTTRQVISMLADQQFPTSPAFDEEVAIIRKEVETVMDAVIQLSDGVLTQGITRAFEAGLLDIPFTPSMYNRGKLLPVRDNSGAIRILDWGGVPCDPEMAAFHKACITKRANYEGRPAGFQMVIDDIYAVSKGRLVGRPR